MIGVEDFVLASDQLTEFYERFKETPIVDFTVETLEVLKDEIKSIWEETKKAYNFCLKSTTATTPDTDVTSVKERYKTISAHYVTCLGSILSSRKKLEALREESKTATLPFVANSGLKVPPCDTDVFYGDYVTWPSFRDMFTAIYINHPKLCPVQKLYHLRAKTKGEAHTLIGNFALTDANFQLAWETLKSNYENNRILVNNQLKKLFHLPSVKIESGKNIKALQTEINDCLAILKSHSINTDNWDPILIYLCSSRLPKITLSLWEQSLNKPQEIPTWQQLNEFLTKRYRLLETVAEVHVSNSKVSSAKPKVAHHQSFHFKTQFACKLCNGDHALRVCSQFLKLPADKKLSTVNSLKYCRNCLAASHMVKDCKSIHTCSHCRARHHTTLHNAFNNNSTNASNHPNASNRHPVAYDNTASTSAKTNTNPHSSVQTAQSDSLQSTSHQDLAIPTANLSCYLNRDNKKVVLATALVEVETLGSTVTLRALLDPGSEVTLISEAAQQRLKLPTQTIRAQISGMNAVVTANASKLCTILLRSKTMPSFTAAVNALVLNRLTSDLPSYTLNIEDFNESLQFELADPEFFRRAKVDLVLGADIYPTILREGLKTKIFGSLLAQNTVFGWVLSGPFSAPVRKSFSTFVSYYSDSSLEQDIAKFWEIEDIQQPKPLSAEDEICEQLFQETTFRNAEGRYVVKLPFKSSVSQLGQSRDIATKRLLQMERSLHKKPDLYTQYVAVLTEYITLRHMKPVRAQELLLNGKLHSYFLPHHAVLKPESTSTKVRVVFNASSATTTGVRLNDVLHVGPTLQSDLVVILVNWRFFKYVFNADIEKMYRQILVHPDHTPFQRILFRKSPEDPIEDHELLTITFGVNCSPYLAIRTLQELSKDVQRSYPLASPVIQNSFYIDDLLSGAHDLQSAKDTQTQVIKALESGGFPLKKWTSNHPDLLKDLPPEDLLNADFLKFDDKSSAKMLGIRWNAQSDQFEFALNSSNETLHQRSFTKRAALSVIAKLFDPAGWLSPIVIVAKIIMQQIWRDGTSWDSQLTPSTAFRWQHFLTTLPDIRLLRIPRWVEYTPSNPIQLHGFSDASEKAYSATLFVRIGHPNNTFSSHLLCAKTKVAPVKQITLPRLELCASVLLTKLIKKMSPLLSVPIKDIYLWTDSSIVLAWLQKDPSTWKTFVINRVAEIKQNTPHCTWNHVCSAENPADLATRGLVPTDLKDNDLWWFGPTWLRESMEKWPHSNPVEPNEDLLETRNVGAYTTTLCTNVENVLERFSRWPRMLKVMSYVFRFISRIKPSFKPQVNFQTQSLSQNELSQTKLKLVSLAQQTFYPQEYICLLTNKPLSKKSSLCTFNPFMDNTQVLRANGRLVCSTLTYNERYPILLPYHSTLSKLLINFVHEVSLHGGNQLTIRLIRAQFWIPQIKRLVKTQIDRCKPCRILKAQTSSQIMAALPPERTTFTIPFKVTGIDFAGPFNIKSCTGRNYRLSKGYVCVFVCFSTKAIHLEAASELSSQVFLSAFDRFISRRGIPTTIFSDNGTNFVGANKILNNELRQFIKTFSCEVTSKYQDTLKWKFIPPGAPHMGGLWEAGVKSFKSHFRKVAGDSKFAFEEFSTLLSRIEACLNSRPISPISDNPHELPPLTPGHFLHGAPLLSRPEPDKSDESASLVRKWERVKLLHHKFSIRWKEEYLKELHRRYKWKYPQRNLAIDDIVVIKDERLPPNDWLLGRIIKLYLGSDGNARVADLRTPHGIIKRPIVKLVPLLN